MKGSNRSRGWTLSTLFTTAMTGRGRLPRARQRQRVLIAETQRLDDEQDQVRVQRSGRGRAVHRPVQRASLLAMQPGRVDEGNLRLGQVHQAQHAVPRGLRSWRDDGKLLAGERIEQRRLADIRATDQRRESAAMRRCSHRIAGLHLRRSASSCNASAAASCSARRRLRAVPMRRDFALRAGQAD